jgi:ADP-ribose pyrophosphatase YjhB (NUDIX family)
MEPKQIFHAYHGDAAEAANFCLACGAALTDLDHGGRTRRACNACGFIRYRGPAPGVAVLVVDEERFLLCRRRPDAFEGGKWCLPCGYVEFDEDFLTAALREVQEETGFVVEITGIISVTSNFLAPHVHTVVTVLLGRTVDGAAQPGDDIDLVRWFSRGEELPELAFESDRHIIARYFSTRLQGVPVDPRFARLL